MAAIKKTDQQLYHSRMAAQAFSLCGYRHPRWLSLARGRGWHDSVTVQMYRIHIDLSPLSRLLRGRLVRQRAFVAKYWGPMQCADHRVIRFKIPLVRG